MSSLTINFVSRDNCAISGLSRDQAEHLMKCLTAGPGSTTITGSDGSITVVNREHFTFATYKEA